MAHGNPFTQFIYQYSPWIVKNIIARSYGFLISKKKYGNPYRETFNYLQRSQWFDSQKINQLQIQELQRTIQNAVKYVPYYINLFKCINQ